ncbi:MAG: pseudouridine-5'-phosphate glycosidase [Planctomycetia bacterium]|nr:pseudouridine-5'-phosphate glycosidase [Planctomycetia bacterium]
MIPPWLEVHPEIMAALRQGRPVVALESSLIAQGLPAPHNLNTARMAEGAIRGQSAVPATVAVWQGRPTIGLSEYVMRELAKPENRVAKLSRRDLAGAITLRQTGATTVASTMFLADCAGVRVFATGGIGGVHREPDPQAGQSWDISADLQELARTPVCVVCAGAKSILDIPRTLEMLETLGVPVIGFGADEFPGFYLRSTGHPVSARVDTIAQAADLLMVHWHLGGGGVVLAQPLPPEVALPPHELHEALEQAEKLAAEQGVRGNKVTPFLLGRLSELTKGKTLRANVSLVVNNARLAARLATELSMRGFA